MIAMQMNAELLRELSVIAEDETLMAKEEFFAKLDEAERQIERGQYSVMLPGEDLTAHLKRLGYDI